MISVLLTAIAILTSLPLPSGGQEGVRDDSHVENVVRQAVADEFSSEILTNRTRAYLSCASGEMVVKLNFSEPFRGVTYTDYDRTSPCRFYGDGSKYYELRIPLKGCGTRQEAPRVFINNIIVRFHRSLELEEDEIKTIICRYPPPLAPPPSPVAPLLLPTAAVPAVVPPKLSEIELLLIICALLFLTLLLLGIGIAYYCLKKRNIKVIKKRKAISTAPGSEITKLSGSTMGTLSMFDPIRIPRAMAQSTSGSDTALLTSLSSQNGSGDHSDTIPSDYPSESPSSVNSDVEEIEGGGRRMIINDMSTMRADHFRYENTAFIPDEPLSDYPEDQEKAASVSSVPIQQILKPVEAKKKLRTRVAREQVLTTISEREDMLQQRETLQKTYAAMRMVPSNLHPPVSIGYTQTREPEPYAPSLYGSIPDNDNRSQAEILEDIPMAVSSPRLPYAPSLQGSIPDNDIWSHSEFESEVAMIPYRRQPKRQLATVTDYYVNTQNVTDIKEDLTRFKQSTVPPPESISDIQSVIEVVEPIESKALMPRKKITLQNIDDVYLTTTTEVHATETVTKRTQDTIQQHVKSPPPPPPLPPPPPISSPPSWDVTIRHYPNQPLPDYDVTDQTFVNRRCRTDYDISEKYREAESTVTDSYTGPIHMKPRQPSGSSGTSTPKHLEPIRHPTYTSVVFKILEPPPVEGIENLTKDVKEKWRTVITTDETFRYLVQEATTIEEYIRITKDSRYEKLFDTRTWNVIIRVLCTPDDRYPHAETYEPPTDVSRRYKKKNEFEQPRNRRSSLPPVCEFSQARDAPPSSCGSIRSRRTSRSGSIHEYDLRSMTEVDVDFAHADRDSLWSVDTGYTYKTSRSLAERSTSEFLEEVPTIISEHRPGMSPQCRSSSQVMSASQHLFQHVEQHMEARDDLHGRDYPDSPREYQHEKRPRLMERSSTEYFEDIPTLSLPDLRDRVETSMPPVRGRGPMDNVLREIRQNARSSRARAVMESSNSEVIINSPLVRAIDLASSVGEREEIKSVTETDIFDWKR